MNTKDDKSKEIHVKTYHSQTWKLKTKKWILQAAREKQCPINRERERRKKKTQLELHQISHQNLQRLEGSEQHFSSAERKEPSTQNPISSESILQKSKRNQGILRQTKNLKRMA